MLRLLFAALPLLAAVMPCSLAGGQSPQETPAQSHITLQTTVRRVVLDVVVTDSKGLPVPGLTKADFSVDENGRAQNILSFDTYGFSDQMEYTPSRLPAQPVNTFINLPTTPEKGPLYVLLFDMANMDNQDQQSSPEDHDAQIVGRQQLVKFIQSKPEGTRFAIFVHSDGLHLVQGFTSDRQLLFAALDPKHPAPHVPRVFLMGANSGQGDRSIAVAVLHEVADYVAEMPGRKNLIWFASNFPLSLFPNKDYDGPRFQAELKAVMNLMAQEQIAVYPVDARGVILSDSYGATPSFAGPPEGGGGAGASGGGGNAGGSASGSIQAAPAAALGTVPRGNSLIMASYGAMDEVARQTGGQAFHGTNDVAGALIDATRSGGSYYTLTYSPTNHDYNGGLRHIRVQVAGKGYNAAYRRSYYATGTAGPEIRVEDEAAVGAAAAPGEPLQRPASDVLSVNMQHGAPVAHGLIFGVQAHRVGEPRPGTPEEMAQLATQPAYFHTGRRSKHPKPLAPEPLQAYALGFRIFSKQFRDGDSSLNLEIAAAAYDSDGWLLNASVQNASRSSSDQAAQARAAGFFSVNERLEVPLRAAYLRFAVRDLAGNRVGAEEIRLPLAPEPVARAAGQ